MNDYGKCARNGCLEFGDDFSSATDVLKLFGVKYRSGMDLSAVPVPNSPKTLICFYKDDGPGKWHHLRMGNGKLDKRGWEGVRSINEFHDDDDLSVQRYEEELACPQTRYVFYRIEYRGCRFWKFMGVFRLDVETSETLNNPPPAFMDWYDGCRCYYGLVSEVAQLGTSCQ